MVLIIPFSFYFSSFFSPIDRLLQPSDLSLFFLSMSSPFCIDLNEDQTHHFDHFSSKFSDDYYASSSSNSTLYPNFSVNPSPQQFPFYQSHFLQPLHHQDQAENTYALQGGSLDHPGIENENGGNISVCKEEDGRESSSVKWMSSKMRLMKKMMKSDQTAGSSSNQMIKFEVEKHQSSSLELEDQTAKNLPNTPVRVCSDCNTTKTPLWRSGPRGPKSLCNACGIRQRKARRALAAAQESGNGAICDTTSSSFTKNKPQNKVVKKMSTATAATATANNSHLPFKKRCKFMAQSRGRKKKKLCFEDLSAVILSKNNAALHQVFPQDEKEAAILLMALSYGLVCG